MQEKEKPVKPVIDIREYFPDLIDVVKRYEGMPCNETTRMQMKDAIRAYMLNRMYNLLPYYKETDFEITFSVDERTLEVTFPNKLPHYPHTYY